MLNPAFSADDIEREKKVVLEEIKMVEDTPDDLVHELFTQGFWENHPLGRPILGRPETVESFDADVLREYFRSAYTAAEPDRLGRRQSRARACSRARRRDSSAIADDVGEPVGEEPPTVVPKILIRNKELEQSHLCLAPAAIRRTTTIGTRATC